MRVFSLLIASALAVCSLGELSFAAEECGSVTRVEGGGQVISAECKGGIINTRHPGQVSRLYKGLCETVGMLMATPAQGRRQVAVVPMTEGTIRLAERLAPRCALAGIEIALVGSRGEVVSISPGLNREERPGQTPETSKNMGAPGKC